MSSSKFIPLQRVDAISRRPDAPLLFTLGGQALPAIHYLGPNSQDSPEKCICGLFSLAAGLNRRLYDNEW